MPPILSARLQQGGEVPLFDQGVDACPRRAGCHDAVPARSAHRVIDACFTCPEPAGPHPQARLPAQQAGQPVLPAGMAERA